MKTLAVLIFAVLSSAAHAMNTSELVEKFASMSQAERAEASYTFCEQAFGEWPAPGYQFKIFQLGELWSLQPEAAYQTLSLCQSMWQKNYLDPVRAAQIKKVMGSPAERARLAIYLLMADVLNVSSRLPEEIRLYNTTIPHSMPGIPPSPFEILSHLSSSERQMDILLMDQIRNTGVNMATLMIGVGGNAAVLLKATKAVAEAGAITSKTVGTYVKSALVVNLVTLAAAGLADYGIWRAQQRELSGQLHRVLTAIENSRNTPHLGLYLPELKKAAEQLGYFYNINLYLRDSGDQTPSHIISTKCLPAVKAALEGKDQDSLVAPFLRGALCQDATLLWIAVSQFLNARFPNDKQARIVADGLMARAKRGYLSQLEIQAYWDSLPVCHEVIHPLFLFKRVYQCGDGDTA